MAIFSIQAAYTALSKLLSRASRHIAAAAPSGRRFGAMRGELKVDDSLFDRLCGDDLAGWDG